MKIHHREPYAQMRARDYPSIPDQIDAIFKLARSLRDSGIELPVEVQQWIEDCESVKEAYPKF